MGSAKPYDPIENWVLYRFPNRREDQIELLVQVRFPQLKQHEHADRAARADVSRPHRGGTSPMVQQADAYRQELSIKSSDELLALCMEVRKRKEHKHPPNVPADSIWGKPYAWPSRDPFGYVFLGRAMGKVGEALFGDEWTGEESPPPLADAFKRVFPPPGPENRSAPRFMKVLDTIVVAAESKQLITAARPKAGGAMVELPAHNWNSEALLSRFHTCQLDPLRPFDPTFHWPISEPHWIYVTDESLAQFIKTIEGKAASSSTSRNRAIKFLKPIVSEPKPRGTTNAALKQECMAMTGVNDAGFRYAWSSLRASGIMDPSWSRAGAPKLHD